MELPAPDAPSAAPSRRVDAIWLAISVLVVGLACALQVTPDAGGVTLGDWRLPELCLVKRSGGTCPGCGMTRSFIRGVRGDPAAFRFHPAGPLLLLFVVAQLPYRTYRLLRPRPAPLAEPDWRTLVGAGLFSLLLLGAWATRMAGWLP